MILRKLIGGSESRQRANTSVWERIGWKRIGYDDDDDDGDDDDEEEDEGAGGEEEERYKTDFYTCGQILSLCQRPLLVLRAPNDYLGFVVAWGTTKSIQFYHIRTPEANVIGRNVGLLSNVRKRRNGKEIDFHKKFLPNTRHLSSTHGKCN